MFTAVPAVITTFGDSKLVESARRELIRGVRGMIGRTLRIESRLPPDTTVRRLGAFGLKGLPGLETISQLAVPDLSTAFPPLRLETPVRVTD